MTARSTTRRTIVERIGHLCDYILFDEAWAGFMKFHPLYERRFAMGLKNLGAEVARRHRDPIDAQAARELFAGLADPCAGPPYHGPAAAGRAPALQRSFMLHASTSPFYPLFASLDVGAQMMKGRSGEVLWDDTVRLGIELRKKMRAVRREFEEKEKDPARRWFFDPFVPDRVSIPDVAREGGAARCRLGERADRSAGAPCAILGAGAGRRLARLHPASSRASRSPTRTS